MKSKLTQVTTLLVVLALTGCAALGTKTDSKAKTASSQAQSANPFAEGKTLYTLTNLHPDPARNLLYSSNFQMPGLIPRCTAVTVKDKSSKRFIFTVKDVEYRYDLNKRSTPEGLDANLKQYFGSRCDKAAVTKLSATDQKGIREGKPYVGMSRQGLIYAIGYPPVSPTTPDLKAPVWKYFINRFNTMNIEFNSSGNVSKIVN